MPFLGGDRDPSTRSGRIPNVSREYEREQEGRKKQSQVNDGQLRHLDEHDGENCNLAQTFKREYRSDVLRLVVSE